MDQTTLHCFLINHTSRDSRGKFEITLYAVTEKGEKVKITIDSFRPLFFIPRITPDELLKGVSERKSLDFKGIDGTVVDCLYFSTNAACQDCSRSLREQGIAIYESDIVPVDRYLMERFVTGGFDCTGVIHSAGNSRYEVRNPLIRGSDIQPKLLVMSIDIETNAHTNQILSIAAFSDKKAVFIIGECTDTDEVFFCKDEKELLTRFFEYVKTNDPDILIGWNVIDFDLKMLQERSVVHSIPFALGRDSGARILPGKLSSQMIARIPGRAVMDVPTMLRTYFHTFEEYSLNFVASQMLGKTKTIELTDQEKINEIIRQFSEDKFSLASYNLQDTILTMEIFEKAGILPNAIERSKRSGQLIDRSGGSIAAFDYLYLPRLHREGYVARNASDIPSPSEALPGGYVIEPVPGIYENVLVFDFRSLYPSIIMTFKIDPFGLIAESEDRVKGPVGPSFARNRTILPGIIRQLMEARAAAKRDNNPYLSQSIKILMNSFYGVLGATNCRFFSSPLATTITKTGQYILKQMIEYIASNTLYRVIYGDTDSLFVLIGKGKESEADAIGEKIASDATSWLSEMIFSKFNTESALKLEYQTHFRHFFMPAVRGATHGSKKHYCGSIVEGEKSSLIFKGMESARSDWTDLAKEFQSELFTRVFSGKPVDSFILDIVSQVKSGKVNDKLIYKKRLRKDIEEYTVNVPPHAQAARLLDSLRHIVRYYITVDGPQPLEKHSSPIDYNHYIDCQLKPIADTILEQLGSNFEKVVSGQQDLFM